MQDSIFTKIIKGEIPCHRIYEDGHTIAFLDIHPIRPGHTLVVPKKQIDQLWDVPDEDYRLLLLATKHVALRLRVVLGTVRVGVQVIGVDVPHAHIQLIPFNTAAEFHTRQDMTAEPDHTTLASLAQKLAFPKLSGLS